MSELVISLLSGPAAKSPAATDTLDPSWFQLERLVFEIRSPLEDDDLQLALYLLYGLSYRSFAGVDTCWEHHPRAVMARHLLERAFFGALEGAVGRPELAEPGDVPRRLFEMEASDDGPSLSKWIEANADQEQFREFMVHRSAYQLKEADPHSWAVPRLTGPVKTAILEIQVDEYGGGDPARMHSRLFAKSMRALGLDSREDHYLPLIPGYTLATVNLMSGFGLHRRWLGAIVGHLAMFEMTSSRPNRRYGNALRRLGFDVDATDFYDEHVEADAVHENIAAYDLAGGLAKHQPDLANDILFGAAALLHLEAVAGARLIEAWESGESALLAPIPPPYTDIGAAA